MVATLQLFVVLLAVIAVVDFFATRLKIPSAILLVLTGVVLALFPNLPTIELAPEFVLLVVLPPVIYSSAVAMSWREFRYNLRPITLLAVGCVVFTTLAVAAATHWLLHFPGQSVSSSAPLSHRPTPWRPSRSRAGCKCPSASSSFSKAKASPMMQPRSSFIALLSPPSSVGVFSPAEAAGDVRCYRCGRNHLGDWRGLADAAPAPMGRAIRASKSSSRS